MKIKIIKLTWSKRYNIRKSIWETLRHPVINYVDVNQIKRFFAIKDNDTNIGTSINIGDISNICDDRTPDQLMDFIDGL